MFNREIIERTECRILNLVIDNQGHDSKATVSNCFEARNLVPRSLVDEAEGGASEGRLRRICSTDATFNTRAAQLTTYLLKRGYNRNFVTKQIRRASDIPRRLTLQTKDFNKPTRIPFITTFNPSLPHISNIIKKH